jgi:hypothetical protein
MFNSLSGFSNPQMDTLHSIFPPITNSEKLQEANEEASAPSDANLVMAAEVDTIGVKTLTKQEVRKARNELKKAKKITPEEKKKKKAEKFLEASSIGEGGKWVDLKKADEILNIRFSQSSVGSLSREGTDLYQGILTNNWNPTSYINLVNMPDGLQTSMDNRRVLAIKKIVRSDPDFFAENPVKAKIFDYNETTGTNKKLVNHLRLDMNNRQNKKLSSEEIDLSRTPLNEGRPGIKEDSFGETVDLRMGLRKRDFPQGVPNGFEQDPIVRIGD